MGDDMIDTGGTGGAVDATRRRRRWIVAAAAAAAAPAVLFLVLQLATPSDLAHLRPGTDAVAATGLRTSPLVATGHGLRAGDEVVAIGGVPVAELARALVGGRGPADAAAADPAALRAVWRHGSVVPYGVRRDGEIVDVDVTLGAYPLAAVVARTWGTMLFALVTLLVAGYVFVRRPDHPAARVLFVGAGALVGATTWSLGLHAADLVFGTGFWLYQVTTVVVFMAYWTTVFHFALVFPAPHPIARRRAFVPVAYGVPWVGLAAAVGVLWGRTPDPLERIAALAPLPMVHAALFLTLALAAVGVQYRRARGRAERQQIRWVVLAALVAGGAGLLLYLLPPLFGVSAVSPNAIGVIATLFPLAIAVAVVHARLFDIDRLLNRALVYGTLTFGIAAAYVLVVTALASLIPTGGGLGPALFATGLVAVAFQPLRQRLQSAVNRLMYGERDDPAAVLGRLGARLEEALAPDAVLPTLVETVAMALRLPYAAMALHDGDVQRTVATYGRPKHPPMRFPLAYRGEPLGELLVEPRDPEEAFAGAELALLEHIARQAGVAVYAVRTTDDLRRSRERLVAAREEERRRLRRELHDGLGPALASLTLRLDATTNVVDRDPSAAKAHLRELRRVVEDAIQDLRGIVHALRPPSLDDLGLRAALLEQVRRTEHAGLEVAFRAPEPIPALPAAVEVVAFRIVQEALANVVQHARARRVWVSVTVADRLGVVVEDDGVGIGAVVVARSGGTRGSWPDDAAARAHRGVDPTRGVGLTSMRERAAEVGGAFAVGPRTGGGTRVEARLPLDGGAGAASSDPSP
jgi:signal transduction histidine kinase